MTAIIDVEEILDGLSITAIGILLFLGDQDDYGVRNFRQMSAATGADRSEIKRAIADLKSADLVVFASGLMTDDGEVAGSGYALDDDGVRLQKILLVASDVQSAIDFRLARRDAEVSA